MKHDLNKSELECLRIISRVAGDLGVPIMVVGATARQLVFNSPHGIRPYRSTMDWDFGVRVPSWEAFGQFPMALLDTNAFRPDLREHRLIYAATDMPVDLVPFGGLEADGRIQWPVSQSEMDVIGFSDAYAHCVKVELGPALLMSVVTTPLLVALKLLAFADRKDDTDRDITDLWHFMGHYIDAGQSARLWEEPLVSAIGEDFEWASASAFMLGYDVARACRRETLERLTPIIPELIDPYSPYIAPLIGHCESQRAEEAKRRQISRSFLGLRKGFELAAARRAV